MHALHKDRIHSTKLAHVPREERVQRRTLFDRPGEHFLYGTFTYYSAAVCLSLSAPSSKSKGDRREKLNKRMIKRPQRDSPFIGEKSPKVF